MTQRVDLHLHSTCSDGVLTPEEVVRQAQAEGLVAVALCDHDNVDGVLRAQAEGARLGIEVLSGVELSVEWGRYKDIHLLGYLIDPSCPELVAALCDFQQYRAGRNAEIVERINRRLVREGRAPIDFDRVRQRAGGTVGRPHIAMELIDQGYVGQMEDAFQRYLVPCNVPKRYFPVAKAIDLIHHAGGVAVLAHPSFISRDHGVLQRLLQALVALGLDGVEAYNNGATDDEAAWMVAQARHLDLAVTGGSDFHGIDPGLEQMGLGRSGHTFDDDCVTAIRRAWSKRFDNT